MATASRPGSRLLRRARLVLMSGAGKLGLPGVFLRSSWRSRRLLILGYHGISLCDEHEWNPALYLAPEVFRSRMAALRELDCAVLPLGEALDRLYAGTLPPRAVAITFDDGAYDFYRTAFPMLRALGFPATVYVTSYYSAFNRPVFDVMLSYVLWKARGGMLDWPPVLPEPLKLDGRGRERARAAIKNYARTRGLSGAGKDELLLELAGRAGLDYALICARRILHLMNAAELAEVSAGGVDLQLHTHRHRVSRSPERFVKEIEDNRAYLRRITGREMAHFCYPAGVAAPEFAPVLRAAGIRSGVTCRTGLASPQSDPLFLPRVLDISTFTRAEFEAWVSGFAEFIPRRSEASSTEAIFEAGREQFLEVDLDGGEQAKAAAAQAGAEQSTATEAP